MEDRRHVVNAGSGTAEMPRSQASGHVDMYAHHAHNALTAVWGVVASVLVGAAEQISCRYAVFLLESDS
jgi:hypothetical protein